MRIIELSALPNGAHRNQSGGGIAAPSGWAVIPDDMAAPDTWPFVGVETDGDGVVTALTAGTVPEPEPEPAPEPTLEQQVADLKTQLAATQDALDALIMS